MFSTLLLAAEIPVTSFCGALGPYHSDTLSPPNGTCRKLKKLPKQNITK
jgi:hypothetical protein